MTKTLLVWAALLAAMALLGCVGTPEPAPVADGVFRRASATEVSATEYRVAPPDRLRVRAPGVKELDGYETVIRPDGMIQLNLIGEVYVAGQTPREIGRTLTDAAGRYFNAVSVQVDVTDYASKFYAVFGTAVREPGRKPYTGRDTVISALASAGFNEKSWPQKVRVSRPTRGGDDGDGSVVEIDMTRVYLAGDTRQNYLLNEGDIIYVPNSPLAAWEEKTRQLFGPLSAGAGTVGAVQGAGTAR